MTQETIPQNVKNQLKSSTENEKTGELKRKLVLVHGQFYRDPERPSRDKENSLASLCSSGLRGETGILIIAAKDQALNTHHQWNIMKKPTDSNCRMYYKREHIKHAVPGCTTLIPSEYTNGHS